MKRAVFEKIPPGSAGGDGSAPMPTARFLRLAGPNILSNLLVPLASLVDVALLGHLSEIRYLAGVALATVLFDYVYWSFGFLRMGTTGLTAQSLGRGDERGMLIIGLRGWMLALGLGVLLLLLRHPLRDLGFFLLNGDDALKLAGRRYFDARIWAAPATLLNFVFLGWFLGREQSGRVLAMSAVGHGCNIALDWLFIARFGWAATGAGAATAISQYLMLASAVAMAGRTIAPRRLAEVFAEALDRAGLRRFFELGGDITVRTLLLISTFAAFTNLAAAMGTLVLAATAVLRNVVMFVAYFVDGYAFATESLAGIYRGARDHRRLWQLLLLAGRWGLGTALLFAVAFLAYPRALLGLLTDHPEVLDLLQNYVVWLLPVLVLSAPAYILDGYFLGLTAGRTLSVAMAISVGLGFAPWAWWAHQRESAHLLWLALSVFMLVRTLTLSLRVRSTLREQAMP